MGTFSYRKDSHPTSCGRDHLKPPSYCYYGWFTCPEFPPSFQPGSFLNLPLRVFWSRNPILSAGLFATFLAESIVPRPCESAVTLSGSCFHHETNRGAFYLSLGKANIRYCFGKSQDFLQLTLNILLTWVINILLIIL